MQKFLHDLYYGRISPWERPITRTAEDSAIIDKIAKERSYFVQKMLPDDLKRFENFEILRASLGSFEEADSFSNGFTLGVKFMCDVFMNGDRRL